MGSPGGAVVKNLPANVGDARDTGSIPGWGRLPGVGNDNPWHYSCLGNIETFRETNLECSQRTQGVNEVMSEGLDG